MCKYINLIKKHASHKQNKQIKKADLKHFPYPFQTNFDLFPKYGLNGFISSRSSNHSIRLTFHMNTLHVHNQINN